MKTMRCLAFSGFLYVMMASAAWAAVPLTSLVDDRAPLLISFRDVPSLVKNWNASPWVKTWNDGQMKQFLAPLRAQIKVDAWDETARRETGCTVEELFALATGDALFVVQNVDAIDKLDTPEDLPVLIAIELGGNADKLDKIIAAATGKEGEPPVVSEVFAGVPVYTQPFNADSSGKEAMTWAFVDGVGLLSWSKPSVLGAIDALKKGGVDNAFGQSERFVRARQQTGDTPVLVFANLQTIVPVIRRTIAGRADVDGGGQAAPRFDPGPLLDALGLDVLESFYFGVDIGDANTSLSGGLTYNAVRGLVKLLAYRDGPTVQPPFVSPKWLSVSSSQFSVRDAYGAFEEMLGVFNPMVGALYQNQVKSVNTQLGIDLKRDLVGSLGDTVITATAMPAGGTELTPVPLTELQQLYAISLQNVPAFTAAVEGLKRLMGPDPDQFFKKREYLGAVIHTFAPPGGQAAGRQNLLSYAITSQYLFVSIGSPAMLETALQGSGGGQPSLWDDPEIQTMLAGVPATASSIQFQDTRAMISILFETAVRAASRKPATPVFIENDDQVEDGGPAAAKKAGPFDASARPDPEVIARYWGRSLGYGYRDSQGFYFRSQLNHAK